MVKGLVSVGRGIRDGDGKEAHRSSLFGSYLRSREEVKPLLLIGNAHSKIEDGHCIAVLNPDMELVDSLVAGCGYERSTLKWEVAKRCDVALDVWIDAYKTDGVFVGTRYRSRNPQPAKFAVV